MGPRLPAYFDMLIAARRAGHVGRHVHLGYWDDPPPLSVPVLPGEFEAAQARLTARMIRLAPLRSGENVLDIACGFGGLMAEIDARLDGMRLTGLNIDRRQLALCRGAVTGPGNTLGLVAGDACSLPFPSGCFDHAFCVEAMFHFDSRQRFLAEAARVLRLGGTLTVSDILLRPPASGAPWDAGTIAGTIRREYGPWPDPWADTAAIVETANFRRVVVEDWSANSLPSYRTIAPDPGGWTRPDPSAGDVFRWMHRHGCLTYMASSFRKCSEAIA